MDREGVREFLARRRYGVVSSVSERGVPQSALVGIAVTPELEIIFDTVKGSRKYPNLVARPECSFVVGWEGEQTVQLEGIAFEPVGEELVRYQAMYFAVWPEGRKRMHWPDVAYFVVRPGWVRFSDYGQVPAVVVELTI
jgi:pyridoxine/pyridoxamine 5'-phosphate oxidase